MIILGIDTSCDDTSIAVVEAPRFLIKSNIVSSQVKLHSKYGGVYPMLAKREHEKNLPLVFQKALKKAVLTEKQISAIAVTAGPGLEPCLWEGINFALALAKKLNKPLIPVNHIEAHLLANWLCKAPSAFSKRRSVPLPAIGLVVSGGHTELILIEKIGRYKILGQTRDDAAGECFDKTARILGLGYPGGPAIAKLASKHTSDCHSEPASRRAKNLAVEILREYPQDDLPERHPALPRPMINSKDYDFSFSGLKTAVLYNYKKQPKKVRESTEYKIAMAKEIQQAIIDVLLKKTFRAAKDYRAKVIVLGGGVVSNESLKQQFKVQSAKLKVKLLMPPKKLCLDNGAMVAMAGFFNLAKAKKYATLKANGNLNFMSF